MKFVVKELEELAAYFEILSRYNPRLVNKKDIALDKEKCNAYAHVVNIIRNLEINPDEGDK